jgi:hypothetical protein
LNSRDKLDELLARGRLSAPRRERIFEQVDRRVRGSRARSKYLIVAAPLALAATLALLLRPQGEGTSGYASKGVAPSNLELGCSGGQLSHCPRGSKLIFHIDALPTAGFLHAFAEPTEKGQERVWYYPTATNAPPPVGPAADGQIMGQGIMVGPEHALGHYRVHLVVAATPLSREELLASSKPNAIAADVVEMVVVDP